MLKIISVCLILFISWSFLVAGEQYIHHELEVLVNPEAQFIKIVDNNAPIILGIMHQYPFE